MVCATFVAIGHIYAMHVIRPKQMTTNLLLQTIKKRLGEQFHISISKATQDHKETKMQKREQQKMNTKIAMNE